MAASRRLLNPLPEVYYSTLLYFDAMSPDGQETESGDTVRRHIGEVALRGDPGNLCNRARESLPSKP